MSAILIVYLPQHTITIYAWKKFQLKGKENCISLLWKRILRKVIEAWPKGLTAISPAVEKGQ